MHLPDLINGSLEFIGAAANSYDIRILLRDKQIRGIHWAPSMFYTGWSFWNMFFYPSLGQWFSFTGALAMLASNLVWVCLAAYYIRKEKQ